MSEFSSIYENELLNLIDVKIIDLDDERSSKITDTDKFNFYLKLTTVPQRGWQKHFVEREKHYSGNDFKRIRFQGAYVVIVCKPADLKGYIEAVNANMAYANKEYRNALRTRAEDDIANQKARKKVEDEEKLVLRDLKNTLKFEK